MTCTGATEYVSVIQHTGWHPLNKKKAANTWHPFPESSRTMIIWAFVSKEK